LINTIEFQKLLDKAGISRIRIHGVDGKIHRAEFIYEEENVPLKDLLDKLEANKDFFTIDGTIGEGLFSGEIAIKHQ
jgi:hypothetical protein